MIFGNRLSTALLALLAAMAMASLHAAPSAEVAALIQRLARPAPVAIAFTEVRFSPLLKAPLIVSGELGYQGPASLDRRVLAPYRELTTIRGESVRVAREGEAPRTFSSARAPELRGLLDSFSALLAGDAALLERSFEVVASEDGAAWRIELAPKEARARRRLRSIVVTGDDAEPRCVLMINTGRGAGVTVLGDPPPGLITPTVTLEQLQQYCRTNLSAGAAAGTAQLDGGVARRRHS